MSKTPSIDVETNSNIIRKYGSFKIDPRTKWLPLCPEKGTIVAAADGKPLPSLRVRALGKERMELTNTSDFSAERLNGIEFLIGGKAPEESARNKEMSCTATIESTFYGAGPTTTHTCSLGEKNKKRKK
jgi:hypothetical protein